MVKAKHQTSDGERVIIKHDAPWCITVSRRGEEVYITASYEAEGYFLTFTMDDLAWLQDKSATKNTTGLRTVL